MVNFKKFQKIRFLIFCKLIYHLAQLFIKFVAVTNFLTECHL